MGCGARMGCCGRREEGEEGGDVEAEVDVVDGGKLEAQGEGYLEGTCTVEGVAFRVVDVEEG